MVRCDCHEKLQLVPRLCREHSDDERVDEIHSTSRVPSAALTVDFPINPRSCDISVVLGSLGRSLLLAWLLSQTDNHCRCLVQRQLHNADDFVFQVHVGWRIPAPWLTAIKLSIHAKPWNMMDLVTTWTNAGTPPRRQHERMLLY